MKPKFSLTTMFLQGLIFLISTFDMFTQSVLQRQPTKLFMQTICICSLIALGISLYNYFKEDKD